jgi:hypothetical protein
MLIEPPSILNDIVMDFINALLANSSVNTVQQATTEKVVFSADPTNAPIDWLDSDHVICVYCRSMSVPRLYNESHELLSSERIATRSTEEYKKSAFEDFKCVFKTLCVL